VLPSYSYIDTLTGHLVYLGTDLGRTLTQQTRNVTLETLWHLTPKTDFIALGDQEWARFPRQDSRDSDSNRIAGGFQVASETRLSGRAVGGVRLFRAKDAPGGSETKPYADVSLDWRLGAKTSLRASYRYDAVYSAFDTVDGRLPLMLSQGATVSFDRRFLRRFSLELEGGVTRQRNDGQVVVTEPVERTVQRNDRFYMARADLGFFIFERFALRRRRDLQRAPVELRGLRSGRPARGASIRFNPGVPGGGARGGGTPAHRRWRRVPAVGDHALSAVAVLRALPAR
jgi:hypothetical protein